MLINTARGLAGRGHQVDYLSPADGAFLGGLPADIRHRPLPDKPKQHRAALVDYIRDNRPDSVIVGKDQDAVTAIRARDLAGTGVRVVVRPGTTVSRRLAGRNAIKRWRTYRALRRTYRQADGIVANSEGVRDDIASITGIPGDAIHLVRNPVITPDFHEAATADLVHPWFAPDEPPVLLGAGGLRRQKDFATLVAAFARVRQERDARLVILGGGHLEKELWAQARALGVAEHVMMPGFVENPYPWMAQADLFVLSSLWEGSPNVLTEALALGTPVVATDCPSGPREILQGGQFGPLVPPGQPDAMAQGILDALRAPLPAAVLQSATADYTMERNAEGYETMLRDVHERAANR